ncbi:MAG: DUF6966 domain-containing protein [Coprobacillaceae bacterium]
MNNSIEKEIEVYKMNNEESIVWRDFQDDVLSMCTKIEVLKNYKELIEKKLETSVYYVQNIGYSSIHGYYFLEYGDRGKVYLDLVTKSKEEAILHILTNILVRIGQKIEIENRSSLIEEWHYDRGNVINNVFEIVEVSKDWKYDTVYDSRLFWFTFTIQKLNIVIPNIYLYPLVQKYTFHMNNWFEKLHWGFDRFSLEFYELNTLKEIDTISKRDTYNDIWIKNDGLYLRYLLALYTLFKKCGVSHWAKKIDEVIKTYKKTGNTQPFLSLCGGMGTINDIWICEMNGHNIQKIGEPWVNELLRNLIRIIINISGNIKENELVNIEEIRKSTGPITKYLQGQRCLECGYKKMTVSNVDNYIASATIPDLLILSIHTNEVNELIERSIKGEFYWLDKKRELIFNKMKQANIKLEENYNRVCPSCGNTGMAVYRWVNCSDTLIEANNNLKVKSHDNWLKRLFKKI